MKISVLQTHFTKLQETCQAEIVKHQNSIAAIQQQITTAQQEMDVEIAFCTSGVENIEKQLSLLENGATIQPTATAATTTSGVGQGPSVENLETLKAALYTSFTGHSNPSELLQGPNLMDFFNAAFTNWQSQQSAVAAGTTPATAATAISTAAASTTIVPQAAVPQAADTINTGIQNVPNTGFALGIPASGIAERKRSPRRQA